jgi:hypothetical protein
MDILFFLVIYLKYDYIDMMISYHDLMMIYVV